MGKVDFCQQWPFRGSITGLNDPGRFEVRPAHQTHGVPGYEQWYPATLTRQREDGLFEALVTLPAESASSSVIRDVLGEDLRSTKDVYFPAVNKNDIREVSSKQPLHVSQPSLFLGVPQRDPLAATLTVDGRQAFEFLARPTPGEQCGKERRVVSFTVSDDRQYVSSNVGHSVLSHFLSSEARSVSSELGTHSHSWTIQLGPFAEHQIRVEWGSWPSNSVKLIVDGEPLLDSTTALARSSVSSDAAWVCNFRFVGEKVTDCEVHEINREGAALQSKGHVLRREKYTHRCSVRLDFGVGAAQLLVDGAEFMSLPPKATKYPESNLCIERSLLRGTYGFELPSKVNLHAPVGIVGGLRAAYASEEDSDNGIAAAKAAAKAAAENAGSSLVEGGRKVGTGLMEFATAMYESANKAVSAEPAAVASPATGAPHAEVALGAAQTLETSHAHDASTRQNVSTLPVGESDELEWL